jgi:hypothetical protein
MIRFASERAVLAYLARFPIVMVKIAANTVFGCCLDVHP